MTIPTLSAVAPTHPRLTLDVLPEYSSYLKRCRKAALGLEEESASHAYLTRLQEKKWTRGEMEEYLAAASDAEELEALLRRLRREVVLSLLVRDVTGAGGYEEVVSVISDFAELAVSSIVAAHARELAARFGVPSSEDGTPQDLMVVGMGKLGGAELNVSSDIDLIFVYDEDGECRPTKEYPNVRKTLSNREFYERLAKKIIPGLSDITYEGFVFRVDMRLRPNGDAGPICCSNSMLEDYLVMQGRDWERFAWSKGRVINTPVFTTPEQFAQQHKNLSDTVRPFVYRKYLDFSAISSLTELHRKIRIATHQRELNHHTKGRNVKLGRGGIREIEFIVQTFQVIRGGRNKKLQERSTLASLRNLSEEGVIEAEKAEKLAAIYVFLRNFEHALQYVDDQQTQIYPDDPAEEEKIAGMLGFSRDTLEAAFKSATEYVAESFDEIFQTDEGTDEDSWPIGWDSGKDYAQPELSAVLASLGYDNPDEGARRLLALMSVRALKLINSTARNRMRKLVRAVVTEIPEEVGHLRRKVTADDLLERFIRFLEVIAGRPTYVSLLLQYSVTRFRVAEVLAGSRWAAGYLLRHPLLLDELWDERVKQIDDYTPVNERLIAEKAQRRLESCDKDDEEMRINVLREVQHAELFRLLLADLDGRLSVERLADHLSGVADAILTVAIEEVWKTMHQDEDDPPKFAVISYGKLGGKELGYAGDLDLVFLYDDDRPGSEKLYVRFARKLMNWLTVTTSSGDLYDVDLRLRPNGESGMLVCTLEAFRRYQENADGTGAWLWEHQALTRARFSAGDADIGKAFEKVRSDILMRPRDTAETARGVLAMRQKMHDGHVNTSGLFDVKHDAGGMVDVEFIVQFLVLAYSSRFPSLVHNFGNIKLLAMAAEAGLIDQKRAEEVAAIYRRYRRIQHVARLNGSQGVPVRVDSEEIREKSQSVRDLWQEVFSFCGGAGSAG
jgi:glutamate-ammonia-ligase adenylyltransferase